MKINQITRRNFLARTVGMAAASAAVAAPGRGQAKTTAPPPKLFSRGNFAICPRSAATNSG